jgi:CubicO group peptidase (beta-lactamase class C family)
MRIGSMLLLIAMIGCSSTPAKPRFSGIADAVERGEVPKAASVLVMHRGAIVHEAYFSGATAETLHDTRSVGKSITSLAVGIAIERGLLPGKDARVFDHLGDLEPFAHATPLKAQITVEDFLTMSSALDCNDDDMKSPGNEENMYPLQSWARWAVDLPTRKTYERDASGRGPWHYCTAGTFLLGQVLQRVAKQSVEDFIARELFAPLGITKWELAKSPTGEVMTGGGLRLTSRDLGKLGELVRNGGRANGKQVVPAAWIAAATTVHRNAFPEQDYGYLFWRRTYHTKCGDFVGWYMSGNGGNSIITFAELEAVVVVTRTHYGQRAMHKETLALVQDHVLPPLACAR